MKTKFNIRKNRIIGAVLVLAMIFSQVTYMGDYFGVKVSAELSNIDSPIENFNGLIEPTEIPVMQSKHIAGIEYSTEPDIQIDAKNIPQNDINNNLSHINGLSSEEIEKYKNDGSWEQRVAFTENLINEDSYKNTNSTKRNLSQQSDALPILPDLRSDACMPSTGIAKVAVFLVEFPDYPHDESITVESVKNDFFGESDEIYGSLSSYYKTSSYNELSIGGDVYNWYTARHERDYYSDGLVTLLAEVMEYYDSTVDFSQYDSDNNGFTDGIYLHFSGNSTGWGSTFWSYVTSTNISDIDGVKVGFACFLHELNTNTIIHESGHLLGLPDYYSYSKTTILGNYQTINASDIMNNEVGDHNAFSKLLLGWINEPQIISSPEDILELKPISEYPSTAIIYPRGDTGDSSFFIIQYTTDTLNNRNVPSDELGISIYRITGELDATNSHFIYSNTGGDIPLIERIAVLTPNDEINPYESKATTCYYSDGSPAFSGIHINILPEKNCFAYLSVQIEATPSKIIEPDINVSVFMNTIEASVDYPCMFITDDLIIPYLESNGLKINDFAKRNIYPDWPMPRIIDKVTLSFPLIGNDSKYLLSPENEYALVIPAGAYNTGFGLSEEKRIPITLQDTDYNTSYKKLASRNNTSQYFSLDNGNAGVVKLQDSKLFYATISEDGTQIDKELIPIDDVSLEFQAEKLTDGTILVLLLSYEKRMLKLSQSGEILKNTVYPGTQQRRFDSILPMEDGFYCGGDDLFINNNFESNRILNLKTWNSNEKVSSIGDDYLYVQQFFGLNPYTTIKIYDRNGAVLSESNGNIWMNDMVFIGACRVTDEIIVVAYNNLIDNGIYIALLNNETKLLSKKKILQLSGKTTDLNLFAVHTNLSLNKMENGYELISYYILQYDPTGIEGGFFTTESNQIIALLDENFNPCISFSATDCGSLASIGSSNQKYLIGDENGYCITNSIIMEEGELPEKPVISSNFDLNPDKQEITGFSYGITGNELIENIKTTPSSSIVFKKNYYNPLTETKNEDVLHSSDILLIKTADDFEFIYYMPELPVCDESKYLVYKNGTLMDYTGDDIDLTVPGFVKVIFNGIFSNSNLRSITTSASLSMAALYNNPDLERVELLPGTKFIGDYDNDMYGVFGNCPKLSTVILPETLTKIGPYVFTNNKSLTSIILPNNLVTIGDGAFANTGLSEIILPDNLVTIGDSAFANTGLSEIILPDSVKELGYYSFSFCEYLQKVYIGSSLENINGNTFMASGNINYVELSAKNKWLSVYENIIYDKNYTRVIRAFSQIPETVLTLPNTITTLDSYSFEGCENLKEIKLPDNLTYIGDSSFRRCISLVSINIPDTVKHIGEYSFYECYNLIDIKLPDGITNLFDWTFAFCANLKTVSLSERVINVGNYVFYDCNGLTSVILGSNVKNIGDMAFFNCYGLTDINIPDGLTSIGYASFSYCRKLTSITIPDGVNYIGYDAFFGNDNMIINCYENSTAHNYAIENNLKYELMERFLINDNTGIKIIVKSDIIPDGSSLEAVQVTEGVKFEFVSEVLEDNKFGLYDINLILDDVKVQPNGKVTLFIPLPEGYDRSKCRIYYIKEDGEKILIPSEYQNGYIVFETDHLSLYAIVETSVVLGDVNDDGEIDIFDIMAIRDHIFGKNILEGNSLLAANVNKDDEVDIFDIMAIRDHIFGKTLIA